MGIEEINNYIRKDSKGLREFPRAETIIFSIMLMAGGGLVVAMLYLFFTAPVVEPSNLMEKDWDRLEKIVKGIELKTVVVSDSNVSVDQNVFQDPCAWWG